MGAWIEIFPGGMDPEEDAVAPLVGAWIEMLSYCSNGLFSPSLPSWERGLKSVLPHTIWHTDKSLPSWERGLKYHQYLHM